MLSSKKKKNFENSLILSITELGVDKFLKNNKKFDKIINIDGKEHYGISLTGYSFPTLQKLIELDYVDIIEIPIKNFKTTRFEIMDISKLLLYNVFYRKFDFELSSIFINSTMADNWNKVPGKSFKIAYGVDINTTVLKNNWNSSLSISKIKDDILLSVNKYIMDNEHIDVKVKNVLILLSQKYVNNIKNIYFLCLVMSERFDLYETYIDVVSNLIIKYLSYSEVSDVFSQVLLEIIELRNKFSLDNLYSNTLDDNSFLSREALKNMEEEQKKFRKIDSLSNVYILWKIEDHTVVSGELHFKFVIEVYSTSADLVYSSNLLNKLIKSPYSREFDNIDDFKNEIISKTPEKDQIANYLVFMYTFCRNRGVSFKPVIHKAINSSKSVIKIKIQI